MAGEEATTEVLVPTVANISSCSRRLPVIRVDLASQLPIYLRRLAILAAGAVLIPSAWAQAPPGGAAPPAVARQAGRLALHQPGERELGPGQTDVFTVDVAAGLFLHVEAEKKGVDVVLVLAAPAGKPLVTANSPNGAFGPEPASLIAEGSGEYQIRVAKSPRTSETGRYRIELTDLHAPTEQDRTRLQAETEFFASVADDRAQDREKRLQGVVGYGRAAALWHSLRDAGAEALCLHQIGSIYYNLGEPQKALDYYNQALTLRRAAGDGVGEVSTLNNIGNVYSGLGEQQKALDYYSQALPLLRAVGDRARQAAMLTNIGNVYADLGEKQKALDHFNQALPLARAVGGTRDRVEDAEQHRRCLCGSWGEAEGAGLLQSGVAAEAGGGGPRRRGGDAEQHRLCLLGAGREAEGAGLLQPGAAAGACAGGPPGRGEHPEQHRQGVLGSWGEAEGAGLLRPGAAATPRGG